MRYAIIIDGVVSNVIIWDGVCQWSPPVGSLLLALDEGEECGPWWIHTPDASPRFVFGEHPDIT